MRLHHLVLRDWGPFAGEHEVDFDELGAGGLFLIHGATGSGKTSILDAICFALYADVPGSRSRASLRSDHAGPEAVPFVELELTAVGRRLRVRRSPEYLRARRRGEGQTKVAARVVLEEQVDHEWLVLGSRLDEVALVVKDVLGMDLQQFVTVAMLPQGQFAAFLSAQPDQRRQVLERLFDAQRFARVEDWLVGRRREAAGGLVRAQERLDAALRRVGDVLATVEQTAAQTAEPPWDLGRPDQIPPQVAAVRQQISGQAAEALARAELAQREADLAEAAAYAGRALARQQEVGAVAGRELEQVHAQQAQCDRDRTRLDGAERAAVVVGHLEATQHLRERFDRAMAASRQAAECALGVLPELAGPSTSRRALGGGDVAHHELDPAVGRALQQTLAQCQPLVAAGVRSAADEQSHGHLVSVCIDERQAADEHAAASQRRLNAAEQRRLNLEQQRLAAERIAAQAPTLDTRRRELSAALDLVRGLRARSAALVQDLVFAADLRERSLSAREHLVALEERRLAGMAGELAAALHDGEPCCVCGSVLHPAPAAIEDAVFPAQVQQARAAATTAVAALAAVERRLAGQQASIEAEYTLLRAGSTHAGETADHPGGWSASSAPDAFWAGLIVETERGLAEVGVQCAEAASAQASVDAATSEMALRALELEQLRADISAHQALAARAADAAADALADQAAAHTSVVESLALHAHRCPCSLGGRPDEHLAPAEVAARHEKAERSLTSWLESADVTATEAAQLAEATKRLDTVLRRHGFETAEQARGAMLPAEARTELSQRLSRVESQRIRAEAVLAQPDVQAAVAEPVPDIPRLEASHRASSAALLSARGRHTLLEHAGRRLQGLQAEVVEAALALGPAQQQAALVEELASCVSGSGSDNTLRMRLSAYVLAARLEEVVASANERLIRLSDGRFTLEHSDALAGRGARSGLGLRVADAWTGAVRPTTSLSGGESFMASLALALGLGDAVRAEAGGFELQTLFVDEGFGTLDEDSLDQVLAVIDGLRDGGRSVGIVSHVPELRLRIPARLHVHKGQDGSALSLVVDGSGLGAA